MFTPTLLITAAIAAVAAYLLGSVNFAILVSRVYAKDDVRHHGSGNAGMTNILRTYGKGPAVCTALGDFLKAMLAVGLARLLFRWAGLQIPLDPGYIGGIFAVLGHLFPLYFGFRGGKGVMTTLGVMLLVNPPAFLVIAVVFVPLVFITRIVSLSSVLGAVLYPLVTWVLCRLRHQEARYDTICAGVLGMIILIMHHGNIKRLLKGTENRFGKPKQ